MGSRSNDGFTFPSGKKLFDPVRTVGCSNCGGDFKVTGNRFGYSHCEDHQGNHSVQSFADRSEEVAMIINRLCRAGSMLMATIAAAGDAESIDECEQAVFAMDAAQEELKMAIEAAGVKS